MSRTVLTAREKVTVDFLINRDHWVQTSPAGRVCSHEGCTTPLSVYNAGTTCNAHPPEIDYYQYGTNRFNICTGCGDVRRVLRGKVKRPDICPDCRRKVGKTRAEISAAAAKRKRTRERRTEYERERYARTKTAKLARANALYQERKLANQEATKCP